MRQFVKEIKQHHRVERTIDPTITNAGLEPTQIQPKPPKPSNDSSTGTHPHDTNPPYGSSRSNTTTRPGDGFTEVIRTNVDHAAKQEFASKLNASSDKVQFLISQFEQHKERCPIHGGLRRSLFDCRAVESICCDSDNFGFWRRAKSQFTEHLCPEFNHSSTTSCSSTYITTTCPKSSPFSCTISYQ